MKKTVICILMAGLLLFSFSGCGNQQEERSSLGSESSREESGLVSSISSAIEEASSSDEQKPKPTSSPTVSNQPEKPEVEITAETLLQVTVNGQAFLVELEDTAAAKELCEMLPMNLGMGDWEKAAKAFELPSVFTQEEKEFPSISKGQLLLKGSSELLLFYEDWEESGDYTPIGTVQQPDELAQALSGDMVEIAFQLVDQ